MQVEVPFLNLTTMKWKDFLYFSKGERQALTLLLSLIAIAWLTIFYTNFYHQKGQEQVVSQIKRSDTIRFFPHQSINKFHKKEKDKLNKDEQKTSFRQHMPIQSYRRTSYSSFPKTTKFPPGTVLELNTVDTTALKKVPGIGSVFAKRIIKYRDLLGGFYSIEQLREVYGIDKERYKTIHSWFTVNASLIDSLQINLLSIKELASHPYINYKQAIIIHKLIHKRGKIKSWNDLSLLEEFPEFEQKRLSPYLSFD